MQHGSLRAPVRVFMAAVLLCLSFLAAPKAAAAQLQNVNGITLLSFDSQQIVSIGNQTSGRCSWYALRYARTILDGKPCSGSGMWSNGAVWSAAGYYTYSGSLSDCLSRLYEELQAPNLPIGPCSICGKKETNSATFAMFFSALTFFQ